MLHPGAASDEPKYAGYSRFEIELEVRETICVRWDREIESDGDARM